VSRARRTPCEEAVAVGLAVLATAHLLAAGWMLIAPASFAAVIGPAGVPGAHELRWAAAFAAAQGVGLGLALLRPGLRAGVLTAAVAALAILTTDRWVDITSGELTAGAGSLDAALLTLGLALTVAVAVTAGRCRCEPAPEGRDRGRGERIASYPAARGAAVADAVTRARSAATETWANSPYAGGGSAGSR
jgi:hypothetical protein